MKTEATPRTALSCLFGEPNWGGEGTVNSTKMDEPGFASPLRDPESPAVGISAL
jgi:hypothetical protein